MLGIRTGGSCPVSAPASFFPAHPGSMLIHRRTEFLLLPCSALLSARGLQALAGPHPGQPARLSLPSSQWLSRGTHYPPGGNWDSVGAFLSQQRGAPLASASNFRRPAGCGVVLHNTISSLTFPMFCGAFIKMKAHLLLVIS